MERLVITCVIIATFGCFGQRGHHTIPAQSCYSDGTTKICFHYHNITRTIDGAYRICHSRNSELLNSDNCKLNNTHLWQNFTSLLHLGIWFKELGFNDTEEGSSSSSDDGSCFALRGPPRNFRLRVFPSSRHKCHVLCVTETILEIEPDASMQVKETRNVELIVGLTVGIIACIVVAILVAFLVRRHLKNAKQIEMRTATDPEHRVSNEYEQDNGYSQINNHPPVYSVPHQNRRQNDSGDVKGQEVNVDDVRLYDNPAYNQI